MLNGLFVFVVIASILLGASMGRMEEVTAAVLDSAGDAVTLAIGLVGVMAFLFSAVLILFGLWFNLRYLSQNTENTSTNKASEQGLLYWFDWQQALLGCAAIFAPIVGCAYQLVL